MGADMVRTSTTEFTRVTLACLRRPAARQPVVTVIGLLAVGVFLGPARISAVEQGVKSVWDGVYASAQAERGMTAFENYCAGCHSSDLSGGQGPALAGGTFMQRWDFRHVNQLFT